MRIVSWNCNAGFAAKLDAALNLRPDLLVVQEISRKHFDELNLLPLDGLWTGNERRGLAVISLRGDPLRLDPLFDASLPHFLPVHVGSLRILATWASVRTSTQRYVRLMHHSLDHYRDFLPVERGIIVGDLNSATVFDRKHGDLNHTSLVEKLAKQGYVSLWHHQECEEHGSESRPTFYMYRRAQQTWHLDYAFLSSDLLSGASIKIGLPDIWLQVSDHMPLVVDINV